MSTITPEQTALFNLLSDFAVRTVLGWISCVWDIYGPIIVKGNALPSIILRPAEEYFNYCAIKIYDRKDEYINKKFDEMLAIPLKNTFDPIDLLHIIVMISLSLMQNMEITDVISKDKKTSMEAILAHLNANAQRRRDLAAHLHGCTSDHIHTIPQPDEKIFSFAYDRYAMINGEPVKLTNIS